MRIAFIAASLLLAASPVAAQPGSGVPAADPIGKKKMFDDPNRIVCLREHVVGSNRPQKVCMTVAQRQRIKDKAEEATDPGRRSVADKKTLEETMADNGQSCRSC